MARRLCLVTGASAGIGQAIARIYAERGYDLALTARRADRLEAFAAELKQTWGAESITIAADLADRSAPEMIIRTLEEAGRPVDALINNAGYGLQGNYLSSSWADHAAFMQVLVEAPLELTHRVLPGMQTRRFGRIMNVASLAGHVPPTAGATLYGAAKAFLVRFSQALNQENAETGVHVSALCPGFTYSEFHDVNGMRDQMASMPSWLWQDAKTVAQIGYDALEANQAVVVTGGVNKTIAALCKLLPDTLALRLMSSQTRKFRRAD
ncbi:serine 3-dehydrogenase [Candidatus Phycosocius bacilliformis]|uniref:Serine 3-dehydrogenase n=1 Tax=Candidatus Phycosocius bacilliformis TaxID=1445552 RepID=A0A2P2E6J4_9PROT|nr:SDR family oxidoreductase [Candidatus Phycosocius bacilliformis]GBF56683.1 serine 3-dehydrogenase [Candidatus Phycosocius bacilliformis]